MPAHSELASKLLIDAAAFFRTLAEQNEPIKEQMEENATVFEQVAALLAQDLKGVLDGTPHTELAGKLLQDAAVFFNTLAEQNEPLKEQMSENAAIYEHLGNLVISDPEGELE